MPGTVTVGNKKRGATGVYIGRPSPLGNPYKVGVHGAQGECVELFRRHLRADWRERGPLRRAIRDLADRVIAGEDLTLVCWCHPLPCHGDVIKAAIEGCVARIAQEA